MEDRLFIFTPMRILIVEDEPDMLRTLSQAMREEGHAVDEAEHTLPVDTMIKTAVDSAAVEQLSYPKS